MKESIKTLHKINKLLLLIAIILITLYGVGKKQTMNAAKGYPYLIKVNKQQNCVTVYGKDSKGKYTKPVKAMICSTGVATPLGTYRTPVRYRWKILLDDVWGQYCTRITGGILFHSVWYYQQDPSTLSARQYNNLGKMCSHGCIRLSVADAYWIYKNCPIGTTVTIYNSSNPGPLGKPVAIKLPANTGWDPTDIYSKNNPFNNKKPSISGAKNKTIKAGTSVDLRKGITAKNTTGFSITPLIKISGKVDTNKAGKYKITYSVTDEIGRKCKKTITYTVTGKVDTTEKPDEKPDEIPDEVLPNDDIPTTDSKLVGTPKITGVVDKNVKKNTKINKELALKGVTATIGNKKVSNSMIKVVIEDNKNDTFTVTYTLANYKGETVEKVAYIVVDSNGPVITGVEDKKIKWDTEVTKEMALEGIGIYDEHDKMSVDDINVVIKEKVDRYIVCYTAKDRVGNKTTVYADYIIEDYLRFEGVKDHTINSNTIISEDILDDTFVLKGVKAYYKDTDITDTIKVTITQISDIDYEVLYSIYDDSNNMYQQKANYCIKDY